MYVLASFPGLPIQFSITCSMQKWIGGKGLVHFYVNDVSVYLGSL